MIPLLTQPITLEGRLVRLEPLTMEHLPSLVKLAELEDYPHTHVPKNIEAMQRYILTALTDQAQGRALPFATADRRENRVVGSTRFMEFEYWPWPEHSPHYGRGLPDAVEIGHTWLAPQAQRTGLNTEAKLLMLAHAFEVFQVRRVTLKTDARNLRSRQAIARLGAHLDGVLRAHRPAADGGIRDSAVFSILAGEWPAVKARLEDLLLRGGGD
ncbi:GNAT family N-acetyltransferase [Meiothermus sp.]|uniref:GNAT family N-acetyltransferase n=1 Tax=Meiothermus sp. TaxID=1955249 RepID=UPI0026343C4F|nr:GNAT family protein [Meiothermus sp.]